MVERDKGRGARALPSHPLQPTHRVPRAPTIISLLGSSALRARATRSEGTGVGLEGFIIFTRRYRSNPTILIPRRGAIAHLKERPPPPLLPSSTDPRSLRSFATGGLTAPLFFPSVRSVVSETFYFSLASRFNARRMRSNHRTSPPPRVNYAAIVRPRVAAVASVVALLAKYLLGRVGCYINSIGDLDWSV